MEKETNESFQFCLGPKRNAVLDKNNILKVEKYNLEFN